MQATMKSTKMFPIKGDKAEVLGREILKKIYDIGHLTYKLKRDINDIYSIILSKPGVHISAEGYKAELWTAAFDDFSHRWKDLETKRYEVECLVHLMYDLIKQEDEKRWGKIKMIIK